MAIYNTQLTSIAANVLPTITSNTVVSVMYFCNTDNSARLFNLYAIPTGSSTANATVQVYKDIQVAAYDTYVMDMEKLVLSPGDMLQANVTNGNANLKITTTVSYVGI